MLNKCERYEILKVFRICTVVGGIPVRVDLHNWQLNLGSTRNKWTCAVSFILFVLHVLYKSGSLAYALLFVPNVPLHELILHAVLVIAPIMCAYWYIYVYICNPSLFIAYVSLTLQGKGGGSLGPEDELKKDWTQRLGEYSMQDLIAISMPYIVILAIPTMIAAYIYDPSMRLLLYAAFPIKLQNWATLGACTVIECWFVLICATIVVPVWQFQVISFEYLNSQLQELIKKIENGSCSAKSVYRILRSLQIYVSMLNVINRYLIFTWKLCSITLGILNGYAAVAHFSEYPIFGVMYYAILLDAAFIYTIVYEKAFKIPQLFGRAAGSSLLHMHGYRNGEFRRKIQSVRPTGIQVGDFHTMERSSTLIFINFVLVNIVNMLVAYG